MHIPLEKIGSKQEVMVGSFTEKEFKNYFEFSVNDDTHFVDSKDYPHKIWVSKEIDRVDQGFRYGKVLKNTVKIIVDEDDNGNPVVETWNIEDLDIIRPNYYK